MLYLKLICIQSMNNNKLYSIFQYSGGSRGGGGGPNRPRPPLLSDDFNFFGLFFFFACHPGGRSGRRTVPLPNNVNVGPKNSGGKMCRSPPPPPHWATFSGLAGNLDSRPPLFTNPGSATAINSSTPLMRNVVFHVFGIFSFFLFCC